ncbi:MAG TPA: hypothetical protein VFH45_11500 [Acidimicrobiales bacterium]|nr:hypothetical protein [Acidimicrobiales bacterium]
MSRIVALGEGPRVEGFALGGAEVLVADDADQVRAAWAALDDDVGVVVLTPSAAAALTGETVPPGLLSVVMPE